MPPGMHVLYLVFLNLIVAIPQINLDLTNLANDAVLQHDCLHVTATNEDNEIISYCMGEWPSKLNIQQNNHHPHFTFTDLYERNITSQQLYLWSAPLDIIEDYQLYLNQRTASTEILLTMATKLFFNCTLPWFGPTCQYTMDDYNPHHSSLKEIIRDFYFNHTYTPLNLTCYTHLQCNLGSTLVCLDWSDICDGLAHCLGAIDEKDCWQLEDSKCKDNEYRCRNGQCIPKLFVSDDLYAPDCLDKSDEQRSNKIFSYSSIIEPIFRYEDHICLNRKDIIFNGYPPFTISCLESRNTLIIQSMFSDKSNATSDICWIALNCYLQFYILLIPNCVQICPPETCSEIIQQNCPEMFYIPAVPVLLGYVYFAYTKAYVVSSSRFTNAPEYICYSEQPCGGFDPKITLLSFNNATCYRSTDTDDFESNPINAWHLLYINRLYRKLFMCSMSGRNSSEFCNLLTMYECFNSSKCILFIQLWDNIIDCDYGDDKPTLWVDTNCLIDSSEMPFYCTGSPQCISREKVGDGGCDCQIDVYGLCADEYTVMNYIREHIAFPTICDGFTELKPMLINERFVTDETECEQWPCNNSYTHCDGIWNCLNGADEVDCHPSSLMECPLHSHICVSRVSSKFMCLSLDKVNDGEIDCLGATDEPYLCRASDYSSFENSFYCVTNYDTRCLALYMLCTSVPVCIDGDDEQFCGNYSKVGQSNSFCDKTLASIRPPVEEFFCNRLNITRKSKIIHFSLGENKNIAKHDTNTLLTRSANNPILPPRQQRCHRGLNLRIWLDNEKNVTKNACLCPPSFFGDMCQYQSERISLTIQFRAFSDSWRIPFTLVVSLIDDSVERIIHSHQQLTYLSMHDCQRKFNIYLLYSTRPKNQSKTYSIHIDIYEKLSLSYRGSLLAPVSFPFLPVQRIAVLLNIPHTNDHVKTCSDHQCIHGQCIEYFNDGNNSTFCRCNQRWSGRYCNISHTCTCADGSVCLGILANNRSLCVCPVNKWGSQCLLDDHICQLNKNETCQNGGQCIPIDPYVVSNKKFICICPSAYWGDTCEITQSKILLSFEKKIVLPESILVHFIEVINDATPGNGTTFKIIPLNRYPVTIYWPRPYHIAFVELSTNNYYLIVLQKTYNQLETLIKKVSPSDRCPHISEVFNETFPQVHLIDRIKYYHQPCDKNSSQLSCFYDEVHICVCTEFGDQRLANCFEFNHNLTRDCFGRSNCENGAQCLQDSATCPKTSICVCPSCFYGTRCQFNSEGFGMSLDAILGYHIAPHISLIQQSSIVQLSVALTIIMTVAGLVNGILSVITFNNKTSQKNACGFYLLGSSIITLLTMIMFAFKFWILLSAQITYMTNRSFLHFQCISFDFILRVGLNMDQWLNACVAMERANTALKGVSFNHKRSKKMAKYIILALVILTISTAIHDPFHRNLIDDGNDDNDKRIWCIVSYSRYFRLYNSIINMFHFFAPFSINFISAICIIIATARQRTAVQPHLVYRTLLLEQFKQHKNLLIAPIILIILAVPRLIISIFSRCMNSSDNSWLLLTGYFISFIPPMLTFVVFVLPSTMYKTEFQKYTKHHGEMLRKFLRRAS